MPILTRRMADPAGAGRGVLNRFGGMRPKPALTRDAGLADAGDTLTILSVHRRLLYMVDHERFNRSFRRFEFQAELSLDRSEY